MVTWTLTLEFSVNPEISWQAVAEKYQYNLLLDVYLGLTGAKVKKSKFGRAATTVFAATLILGLVQNSANADFAGGSSAINSFNNPNGVNNIREDRHDSPSNPGLVTGSVSKMPIRNAAATGKANTQPPITYSVGAPVMLNPKINVLWYGNWGANPCTAPGAATTTPSVVTNLLTNIGSSDWYGTNTLYYSQASNTAAKLFVPKSVLYGACGYDTGTVGKSLDGSNQPTTLAVVKSALSRGLIGPTTVDPDALYLLLTASDISVSGFLTSFCGYHGYDTATGMKYSFVGDPTKGMASCTAQASSPNSNAAADGMSSVIAHELVEAVSDPQLNAWGDALGNENGDKCAWNFLATAATPAPGAGSYNTQIGGKKYLIQANWNPALQNCYLNIPPLSASGITGTKALEVGKSVTSFVPVTPSAGTAPYSYAFVGALPAGLSINATTGAITGTPSTAMAATLESIQITDSLGAKTTGSFTLLISPPLTLTSLFPVGNPKTISFNVTSAAFSVVTPGGSTATPLTYSVASGALPKGIALNSSSGQLSGKATVKQGSTAVGIRVTDAAGATLTVSVYLSVA